MTPTGWIMITVQGLAFAAWAATLFRTLFHVTGRARRLSCKSLPGPVWTLRAWADWWRDPLELRWRRWLIGLTILMMALNVLSALVLRPA